LMASADTRRAVGEIAMHADSPARFAATPPIDILQVDHRRPLCDIAFAASLHAGLATDAAVGVDEKLVLIAMACRIPFAPLAV